MDEKQINNLDVKKLKKNKPVERTQEEKKQLGYFRKTLIFSLLSLIFLGLIIYQITMLILR